MTIDAMINELKHYTNADLENWTVKQITEAYCRLFEEEE